MLIPARDIYSNVFGIKQRSEKDETEYKIAALHGEYVFHSIGQVEHDSSQKEDTYLDSGENAPQELKSD